MIHVSLGRQCPSCDKFRQARFVLSPLAPSLFSAANHSPEFSHDSQGALKQGLLFSFSFY